MSTPYFQSLPRYAAYPQEDDVTELEQIAAQCDVQFTTREYLTISDMACWLPAAMLDPHDMTGAIAAWLFACTANDFLECAS